MLEGPLDVLAAPQLRSCLQRVVADGARRVTVDFELVSPVDSSGLAVLVAAERRLHALNGSLAVINVSEQLKSVFVGAGLGARFGLEA